MLLYLRSQFNIFKSLAACVCKDTKFVLFLLYSPLIRLRKALLCQEWIKLVDKYTYFMNLIEFIVNFLCFKPKVPWIFIFSIFSCLMWKYASRLCFSHLQFVAKKLNSFYLGRHDQTNGLGTKEETWGKTWIKSPYQDSNVLRFKVNLF